MRNHIGLILIALFCGVFASCHKEQSGTTGWNYNDKDWGSFEVAEAQAQETGPNLVYVPGGTFTMGQTEQDVTFEADAMPRKATVSSFYIDETEVKNLDYREYLHWVRRVYIDYPQVYEQALPDTLVWRDPLAYNEPFVRYYFRHPAYQDYPVVGVSWVQASKYCEWRTDRVNEYILVREKIIDKNPDQVNEENFNTEAYLSEQYDPVTKKPLKNPNGEERRVRIEDGILLPEYRLPTEAEWEYAALALPGNAVYENVNTARMYPWNGYTHRMDQGKYKGKFRANFQRGAGDLMGVASDLNDQGAIPTPVKSYWPNEFGIYNMAGNVSEWVMDVYRPLSLEDFQDFNSFRGNNFQVQEKDADGYLVEKDSLGRIRYRDVTIEENVNRRNYKEADNKGYIDPMTYNNGEQGYDFGVASLVNNEARVYKGGSWRDRAYWVAPGARRFLDQEQSLSTLGFRCAMTRVGSQVEFKQK